MIEQADREWLAAARAPRRGVLAGMLALTGAAGLHSAAQPLPIRADFRKTDPGRTGGARMAILDGLSRYCRAMDRSDRALQDSIWHPDATAQYLDHPVGPYTASLDSGQSLWTARRTRITASSTSTSR
jgi:hypothetical protein